MKKETLIIAIVGFATFISMLDCYIVNISLPAIANYFQADIDQVSPIVALYSLALSCTVLIWGKAADRLGFSKIFICAFSLFTIGSILCTLAPQLNHLIIARIIQGIGGGGLAAVGPALIARDIAHNTQGKAFGFVGTSAALGLLAGAPIGGLITGYFDWRGIFLINVPLGIFAVMACLKYLPKDTHQKSTLPFDYIGAVLSIAFLSLLILMVPEKGNLPTMQILLLGIGVLILLGFLFIFHEKRHPAPLVPPALMKNGLFMQGVLTGFLVTITIGGLNLTLPFHLIDNKGLSTEAAGMAMMLFSAVNATCNPISGRLADKYSPIKMSLIGTALGIPTSLFFALYADLNGLLTTMIFLAVFGIVISAFVPTSMMFVMQAAPLKHKGAGGGTNMAARGVGIGLGTALYGATLSYSQSTPSPMQTPWLFSACIFACASLVLINILRKHRTDNS
ncbi:MAG: MFS transporter [Desulfovibrio sp.]